MEQTAVEQYSECGLDVVLAWSKQLLNGGRNLD
jgi:hypothetical protein